MYYIQTKVKGHRPTKATTN